MKMLPCLEIGIVVDPVGFRRGIGRRVETDTHPYAGGYVAVHD